MKIDLEPFWYWCRERHQIYINKEKKAWVLTNDDILNTYRFCNVYRELDTTTVWIKENWRDKYAEHKNLWFAMCVARQINLPSTLLALGFPTGNLNKYLDRMSRTLGNMRDNNDRIYGPAYILTAGGQSGPKYLYTVEKVLRPIANRCRLFGLGQKLSLQDIQHELIKYIGFGNFIAYEVGSDLRWTRYYNNQDHNIWANPGPGAKRGLSRLFYGHKDENIKPEKMLNLMQLLLIHSRSELRHMPPFEMREIEHSLCETDKYLRVKLGEGRPKQKYHYTTNYTENTKELF